MESKTPEFNRGGKKKKVIQQNKGTNNWGQVTSFCVYCIGNKLYPKSIKEVT